MLTSRDAVRRGRIGADLSTKAESDGRKGLYKLGLDGKRDAVVYVPDTYTFHKPAALAVMLHGAGGNADHGLSLLRHLADVHGMILLAPPSRSGTWDIIQDQGFGKDIVFITQALQAVLDQYGIDQSHIAIGGFSDGASYALCVGLTNGDLFTHVLAFSPGFVYTAENVGKPRVYISHGTDDPILLIAPCSHRIVPQLQRKGYEVFFHEFEGEHSVPEVISKEAVEWFLK